MRSRLILLLAALVLGASCSPGSVAVGAPAKVKADFDALAEGFGTHKQAAGRLPTTSEGLDVLVHRPPGVSAWFQLLAGLPNDPWGRPYQYRLVPGSPRGYELFPLGADGVVSADDIYY